MVETFEPKTDYKVVGTRPIRHDGYDKVTGRAIYGGDMKLPGLIWGVLVRSPHAHANIKSINTSAAEASEGVMAIVTGADMPEAPSKLVDLGEGNVNFKWASNKLMAGDKVLYHGHPVAAIAAVDRHHAEEAARKVVVEYEVLPSVTNVTDAMSDDAPVILPDLVGDDLGEEITNTNIAEHMRHEFGDVEAAFAAAAHTIEREYNMEMVHQGYIEPHNATAVWDEEDRIKIWTSTQGSFNARTQVAGILQIDVSRVKVTPLEIGGGFGGKIPIYLEPVAALLAKKSGRPVKMVMERSAVFETTGPTPGGRMVIKLGADANGILTAATADIWFEAGAYPGALIGPAAMCIYAPYEIANTRIDGWDVVVNKPKTAPYRAPGSPQVAFAMESAVNELCEAACLGVEAHHVAEVVHEPGLGHGGQAHHGALVLVGRKAEVLGDGRIKGAERVGPLNLAQHREVIPHELRPHGAGGLAEAVHGENGGLIEAGDIIPGRVAQVEVYIGHLQRRDPVAGSLPHRGLPQRARYSAAPAGLRYVRYSPWIPGPFLRSRGGGAPHCDADRPQLRDFPGRD